MTSEFSILGESVVSIECVAAEANCSAKTVQRAVTRGQLEAHRFRGRLYVPVPAALSWIEHRQVRDGALAKVGGQV